MKLINKSRHKSFLLSPKTTQTKHLDIKRTRCEKNHENFCANKISIHRQMILCLIKIFIKCTSGSYWCNYCTQK